VRVESRPCTSYLEMNICQNPGCKKQFDPEANSSEACSYHPGKVIFHDIKKGWTCCNEVRYDWDEFERIEGCTRGPHSLTKPDTEFFKSGTVDRAAQGAQRSDGPVPRSIEDFEREEEKRQAERKAKLDAERAAKPAAKAGDIVACKHFGCQKKYTVGQEEGCKYHAGAPMFHDLRKFWTCCNAESWDWDGFMALPTCASGRHSPK